MARQGAVGEGPRWPDRSRGAPSTPWSRSGVRAIGGQARSAQAAVYPFDGIFCGAPTPTSTHRTPCCAPRNYGRRSRRSGPAGTPLFDTTARPRPQARRDNARVGALELPRIGLKEYGPRRTYRYAGAPGLMAGDYRRSRFFIRSAPWPSARLENSCQERRFAAERAPSRLIAPRRKRSATSRPRSGRRSTLPSDRGIGGC